MNRTISAFRFFLILLVVLSPGGEAIFAVSPDGVKKVRLFIIGNSFSQNASTFLPQIVKEKGYQLEIGRAELGGCSLQRHWDIAAAAEKDSTDPTGKAYKGKSLRSLLSEGSWDFITLQQYSLLSGDVKTYDPYAKKLYDYVKSIQPNAVVVFHQTWAYRADALNFGKIDGEKRAATDEEMWQNSRASYREVAAGLGCRVIPSGDAFHQITSDPKWKFVKDTSFDYPKPEKPNLPVQTNSLHVGYSWGGDKLNFDPNHANTAGCYLGSLVWFGFLFDESPKSIVFKPEKVDEAFAKQLRVAATKALKAGKKEDKKRLSKKG